MRIPSSSLHLALSCITIYKCRRGGYTIVVIVYFTHKTAAVSHARDMVVFGGTVFKLTASGIARDASGAVIVVFTPAFQFGTGNRAVFDGRAIAHARNAAHKTVIIYSGCHEISGFDMQILNRTRGNPSKYSCGCVAFFIVYLSGGICVCDDMPATVVIA